MALRFTVQGDDEAETAAGLQLRMRPTLLTDNRWMARAVPTAKASDEEPTA